MPKTADVAIKPTSKAKSRIITLHKIRHIGYVFLLTMSGHHRLMYCGASLAQLVLVYIIKYDPNLFGGETVRWITVFVSLLLMAEATWAQTSTAGQAKTTHDREFWRAIPKNRFVVPEGQAVYPLLRELSGFLGSKG